uniref:Tripartite motif-containing protein 3-like n=1 Tax=Crassostrea virginica TaxID=6565 RepID=A0A8B8B1V1_CRAVI|nr:tripartite motif-containing protein 3-like [Crassostrea virginica]
MATSTSWAQDVIICNLCENSALRFCNSCQTDLCLDCVGKHLHEFESLSHDIVPFQHRKIRLVLPECEFHPGQRCEVHCQQCQTPVCVKCFTGNHKGHDVVELEEILEKKKEIIRKEKQKTEANILSKYQTRDDNIKTQILKVNAEFAKMKTNMERLRKLWHQEVDDIFDKANNLINSWRDIKISSSSTLQTQIKNKIPEVKQALKHQTEVLKSNDASRIYDFKSNLEELKEIPEVDDVTCLSLIEKTEQGQELQIEIEEFRATLSQKCPSIRADHAFYHSTKQLLDEAEIIFTIPVVCNKLRNVVCVGLDEAWITGYDESIKRVDVKGSVKETVATKAIWPYIALTEQGELLSTNMYSGTVDIVKQGGIDTFITPPQGWAARRLCCTRSGDVLVHVQVRTGNKNKLLRYRGQHISQEIDTDFNKKPIFSEGFYFLMITENSNGDICVSDRNAETVTVVDMTGRVRFRYDGTSAGIKNPFGPTGIVTDSLSQIIVSDSNNDCLHIIDQNGKFLNCVDNCGLQSPWGLSVDSEGRLWVALNGGNVIKVIKYIK